ncbi:MAG TPA: hypothetical protein VLT89_08710 [Usitatibacter sp.]|nr:hypothetical protein [Usitatibacter sp.]
MTNDRTSLNRAFWDLGLRFQWDEATYNSLAALPDLRAALASYLERHQPHLLGVYDVEFLRRIIEERLATPGDSRLGMEAHRSF